MFKLKSDYDQGKGYRFKLQTYKTCKISELELKLQAFRDVLEIAE